MQRNYSRLCGRRPLLELVRLDAADARRARGGQRSDTSPATVGFARRRKRPGARHRQGRQRPLPRLHRHLADGDLSNAGGTAGRAAGRSAAGCTNIDYYLQAADAAGNVAVSSKKVQFEPVAVPRIVREPQRRRQRRHAPERLVQGRRQRHPDAHRRKLAASVQPRRGGVQGLHRPDPGEHRRASHGRRKDEGRLSNDAGRLRHRHEGADRSPSTRRGTARRTPSDSRSTSTTTAATPAPGSRSGCTSTPAKGALLNTSTPGTFTFKVNAAVDQVGNSSGDKTVTYTVGYRKVLFTSTRTGNGDVYSMNLDGTRRHPADEQPCDRRRAGVLTRRPADHLHEHAGRATATSTR